MNKNFSLTGWGSAAVHSGHEQDPMFALQFPIYSMQATCIVVNQQPEAIINPAGYSAIVRGYMKN